MKTQKVGTPLEPSVTLCASFLAGISHNSSGILVCACDSQALTDLGEVAYVAHIPQRD